MPVFRLQASPYLILALIWSLVLAFEVGCAPTVSATAQTNPMDAANRRVLLSQWRQYAKRAHTLMATPTTTLAQWSALARDVRQFRRILEKEPTASLPVHERHEMNAFLTAVESLRKSPKKPSMVVSTVFGPRRNPYQWPLEKVVVVSTFGPRIDPFDGDRRTFHNGVDLAAVEGTPIRPFAAGEVIEAGWREDGCGLGVTLQHRDGFISDYCHLSKVRTQVGEYLPPHSVLGEVGNTGRSTGYHLHWSVWHSGRTHDPIELMKINKRP